MWLLNASTSDRSVGSKVHLYRNKQNVIAIVAVRSSGIGFFAAMSPSQLPIM
jgi:hypothetical protein